MTEIHVGDEAHALLSRADFIEEWTALYAGCLWATAGQHPEFVRTWYRIYRGVHEPVLAVSRAPSGALAGVLPLVELDGRLTHAAPDDCPYHVWISAPDLGNEFMPDAMVALDAALGPMRLELCFLPPSTPRAWLEGRSPAASRAELAFASRRVLRVDNPDAVREYVRGKSRLRTTMGKLKRTGNVRFRRVRAPHEIASVLAACEPMFEVRYGAMHGILPFRDDPLRRKFLLAQAEVPGLMHVTVLERDGEILAAHMGPAGKRELSISGIVYSEFEARYSPGALLLLELAVLLSQEGYELLDFTPGDDEYRARFSTTNEPVYGLTLHADRLRREARRVQTAIQNVARSALSRLPGQSSSSLSRLSRELQEGVVQDPDAGPPGPAEPPAPIIVLRVPAELERVQRDGVRENTLDELTRYSGTRSSYIALLRSAMSHIRAGGRMFTRTRDGTLESIAFLVPAHAFGAGHGLPAGASVICEIDRLSGASESWLEDVVGALEHHVQGDLYVMITDSMLAERLKARGFTAVTSARLRPLELPTHGASEGEAVSNAGG
ncbi:MAG TPA: GNAT family N-acetyltransferase [Polyangiaceae bacterium]|nr:GNAT family N-acetyltransferase [Polyangiaceae bacterium]